MIFDEGAIEKAAQAILIAMWSAKTDTGVRIVREVDKDRLISKTRDLIMELME